MSVLCVAIAGIVVAQAKRTSFPGPEQVHLMYGMEANTVTVSWATTGKSANHTVTYGAAGSGNLSAVAVGDTRELAIPGSGSRSTHVATLTGIEEGASYDYQVHQDSTDSNVFSFTYRKQHGSEIGRAHV